MKKNIQTKKQNKQSGFIVFLKIIDKKTGQDLVKLDNAVMKDVEREMEFLFRKFR